MLTLAPLCALASWLTAANSISHITAPRSRAAPRSSALTRCPTTTIKTRTSTQCFPPVCAHYPPRENTTNANSDPAAARRLNIVAVTPSVAAFFYFFIAETSPRSVNGLFSGWSAASQDTTAGFRLLQPGLWISEGSAHGSCCFIHNKVCKTTPGGLRRGTKTGDRSLGTAGCLMKWGWQLSVCDYWLMSVGNSRVVITWVLCIFTSVQLCNYSLFTPFNSHILVQPSLLILLLYFGYLYSSFSSYSHYFIHNLLYLSSHFSDYIHHHCYDTKANSLCLKTTWLWFLN